MNIELSGMEKPDVLSLKAGQLAEMKTFEGGYRGAWFRCKIRNIIVEKNKIEPEFYDFPGEEIKWARIYERPPYGRKSKHVKTQLMVRPHYPLLYHKSEMPPAKSISEVCVVTDGSWKVGDLVDWNADYCYWSARVTNILSNDKVQIELPMPPAGEGNPDEPLPEALCKDLRPTLEWSPSKGWTLPAMENQVSSSAWLVFPSNQCLDLEMDEVVNASASPLNASSTTRISLNSFTDPIEQQIPIDEESLHSQEVKLDDGVVESLTGKASLSDCISHQESSVTWEALDFNVDLNVNHEDTLEAAIMDLEELANRIKWMKNLLESNHDTTPCWKFA